MVNCCMLNEGVLLTWASQAGTPPGNWQMESSAVKAAALTAAMEALRSAILMKCILKKEEEEWLLECSLWWGWEWFENYFEVQFFMTYILKCSWCSPSDRLMGFRFHPSWKFIRSRYCWRKSMNVWSSHVPKVRVLGLLASTELNLELTGQGEITRARHATAVSQVWMLLFLTWVLLYQVIVINWGRRSKYQHSMHITFNN